MTDNTTYLAITNYKSNELYITVCCQRAQNYKTNLINCSGSTTQVKMKKCQSHDMQNIRKKDDIFMGYNNNVEKL